MVRRKRCIVFDLDECLIHTMEPGEKHMESVYLTDPRYSIIYGRIFQITLVDVFNPEGQGVVEKHWGLKRPHLNRLLDYCFKNFDYVCVWSAAHRKYVIEVVNQIFAGIGTPHLIFTRDNIETFSNGDYHKPLQSMLDHKVLKGNVSMSDVVFLDDRRRNFLTCPENGITIPAFKPSATDGSALFDDICLLQLEQFFRTEEFKNAPDVRRIDKSNIFSLPLTRLPPLPADTKAIIYATEMQTPKLTFISTPSLSNLNLEYRMPSLVYAS